MTTRARFDIHVNSRATGIVHAADCVVEEDAGFVRRVDFRYTPRYLGNPGGFPLDPARLPLAPGETRFRCEGGVPGFIDDHLPDAWGRTARSRPQPRDGSDSRKARNVPGWPRARNLNSSWCAASSSFPTGWRITVIPSAQDRSSGTVTRQAFAGKPGKAATR